MLAVGLHQVEQQLAVLARLEELGREAVGEFRPHLVTAAADARAQSDPKVLGPGAVLAAQGADEVSGDARLRASPAGVREAGGSLLGVVGDQGQAVREGREKGHTRPVGDQAVDLPDQGNHAVNASDLGPVHGAPASIARVAVDEHLATRVVDDLAPGVVARREQQQWTCRTEPIVAAQRVDEG